MHADGVRPLGAPAAALTDMRSTNAGKERGWRGTRLDTPAYGDAALPAASRGAIRVHP